MQAQQKTLDNFIKSRKRPANDDIIHNKGLINSSTDEVSKPSRKLSFDDQPLVQTIKKPKIEPTMIETPISNKESDPNEGYSKNVADKDDQKRDNENQGERATTPEQSPTTKAQLRRDLDLGEFRKIVRKKQNLKKLQEKINNVNQSRNKFLAAEAKVEEAKNHYLSSFKSVDLILDTSPIKLGMSPIKKHQLKPTALFPSTAQAIVSPRKTLTSQSPQPKEYVSPRKLLNEVGSLLAMSPSKRFSTLVESNALPLPLKYRILNELFKAMETVTSMMFSRKEKITFTKLQRGVQQMTRNNFTEHHLAQIKSVVPEMYSYSLVKSLKDKISFELVITPVYGSAKQENVDLIKLTTQRKKTFSNTLLDIMKNFHQDYLSNLIPPIVIDKNKITRWHPEFDVESVADIKPSPLPKIEIGKPKITSTKDILDQSHQLFAYNNRLNRTLATMTEEQQSLPKTKASTDDAKNALHSALKGIPKSLLLKIQAKQVEKAKELMTRSVVQLDEDRMMSRLPEIARRIRTYFVQMQKNIMPLKKVTEQLKQSYPEALTEYDWKTHLNLLQDKVPQWIVLKVLDGIEHVKVDKKIPFEESVIKKLNSHFKFAD